MFDKLFSSKTKARYGRLDKEYSEQERQECRELLKLPGKERMAAYNADKQLVYTHKEISPAHQLFVDAIDIAIRRTSRRWGKIEVLDKEIARIKV